MWFGLFPNNQFFDVFFFLCNIIVSCISIIIVVNITTKEEVKKFNPQINHSFLLCVLCSRVDAIFLPSMIILQYVSILFYCRLKDLQSKGNGGDSEDEDLNKTEKSVPIDVDPKKMKTLQKNSNRTMGKSLFI